MPAGLLGQWVAWIGLVLLLPITSLPLLVRITGADSVAAPSGVFLFLLVIGWLPVYLIRRGRLSRTLLPLIWLIIVALFTIGVSAFREIPPFKDISPVKSQIQALITLGIGFCFFLVASTWPKTQLRLEWTLRILNWSGLVVVLWSLAQAVAWYSTNHYPEWMRIIHEWYSIGPLYRQRVTGFTLEPSWLAHQLNMLYLPIWLAATTTRYSAHRRLVFGITFENVLLVFGIIVLLLSLSRVGILAFLLMAGYLVLRVNIVLWNWVQGKVPGHWHSDRIRKMMFRAGLLVLIIAFYVTLLLAVGYGMSKFDPRMKDLFEISLGDESTLLRYANQLTFASRMVYWQSGWKIFNEHPWLGVGLGNAGFYIPQNLSGYAWGLVEIRDLVYRSMVLLNIKSLWVRLLAETGIIGFSFFTAWWFLCWRTSRKLEQDRVRLFHFFGWAGQFVLLALLLECFSLDSFALPYFWFLPGLVSATLSLQVYEKKKVMYE